MVLISHTFIYRKSGPINYLIFNCLLMVENIKYIPKQTLEALVTFRECFCQIIFCQILSDFKFLSSWIFFVSLKQKTVVNLSHVKVSF